MARKQALLIVLLDQMITRELWNAEVPAQVQEVERANDAIHRNQVDIRRACQHDHRTLNVSVLKAYPYVGPAQVRGVRVRDRSDKVLPAVVVVLPADRFKTAGIVKSRHRELIAMY